MKLANHLGQLFKRNGDRTDEDGEDEDLTSVSDENANLNLCRRLVVSFGSIRVLLSYLPDM